MDRRGEGVQPRNVTSQNRGWIQAVEVVVVWVVMGLTFVAYTSVRGLSAPWLLARGIATYALAIVANLLWSRVVVRLSLWPLKRILGTLVLVFVTFPPLVGSISITYTLLQLMGKPVEDVYLVLLTLVFYVLVYMPLAYFVERTTTHV